LQLVKKTINFLLWVLAGAVLTGFGFGYYYWRQMTRLPDWYHAEGKPSEIVSSPFDPAKLKKNQIALQQKLQAQIRQQISPDIPYQTPQTIPLTESRTPLSQPMVGFLGNLPKTPNAIALHLDNKDVQQILLEGIAQNPQTQPFLASTKAMKTTIKDRTIEIGTVINTEEMLKSNVNPQRQQQVEQFIQVFPQFKNRDLYVQFEGEPELKQGKIVFDNNSRIKIGKLSLSIAELSQKLGISPDKITEYLSINANVVDLKDIQLKDNQLTLKVAPASRR